MFRIVIVVGYFVLFSSTLFAQTLHDVIISLSDRQRVLFQREQVRAELLNEYSNFQAEVPESSPINWTGLGTDPTEESINALGAPARIALVNQAISEFELIASSYANISVGEMEEDNKIGAINFFQASDFSPLPRATLETHTELLRQLAQRIRSLRIVPWPSAFEKTTLFGLGIGREDIEYDSEANPTKISNEEGMSPFSWRPETLGTANLDCEESLGASFHVGESMTTESEIQGEYSEDPSGDEEVPGPLKGQTIRFSLTYPKRVFLRAAVQGSVGEQVGGTMRILSRSRWHELTASDYPSEWDRSDGAYRVLNTSTSDVVNLFTSPPELNISGTWVVVNSGETADGPWEESKFVEAGYELKAKSLIDPSLPSYSDDFDKSYEENWEVGCHYFSLFQPNFTRGVDSPAARAKLDQANLVLADNTADGSMLLHPRPGLLYGIDLGPGLYGAGEGLLTAGYMPEALENSRKPYTTQSTYGAFGGIFAPVRRFDSTYALRFAGSANHFHLVFDNDRDGRAQSLPQIAWEYDDESAPGGKRFDQSTLLRDWDLPRIRQVVGRDLIANVTYNGSHYGGYTITIYRRPASAPKPNPGELVPISGLPVIRTWVFSKPGGETTAHPNDPESLKIIGNADEKFEVYATHRLPDSGAGWDVWYDHHIAWMVGMWSTAWWWRMEGDYHWVMKLSQGNQEKWRKEIGIETIPFSPDPWTQTHKSTTRISTYLDNQILGEFSSESFDPFGSAAPADWRYSAAGKAIVGTQVLGSVDDPVFRYGKLAKSREINFDGVRADESAEWSDQGMLASLEEGPWAMTGSPDGSTWKNVVKFNGQSIATEWFEFTGSTALKHYMAPDGSSITKGHPAVATAELEMGTLSSGVPGLPRKLTRSDGTGATFAWTISADGSGTLVVADGLLSGGSVSKGTKVTTDWNARGFSTASSEDLLLGGTLKTAGASVPPGNFTGWGMPKKWKDDFSTMAATWTYDGNRSRIVSATSALGLTTGLSNFDVLDRPSEVAGNGITATHTFSSLNTTTSYSGTDIQQGTEAEVTRDSFGRLLSANSTWNGVVDNLGITHGGSVLDVSRTVGPYGTYTAKIRQADGSLEDAKGSTLPFGGLGGDGVSVSNGLLVTRAEILDGQGHGTGAFEETHTDAFGRVRRIVRPSKSGNGSSPILITYSHPSSSLRRVITTEPTGRVFITESDPYDSSGAVARSGIDVDGNGSLGAVDRYVESITEVVGSKVVTSLKITEDSGLRDVLRTEWTPSSGVTGTKINGNEETITTTPNRTTKTVTTTSSKGWTRTTSLNSLGLPTGNTLSGAGIPTAGLTPVWRADGSLASVELTIGGETHSADFHPDGRLSSLTAPGRGNILGGHSIQNGSETLTVDGVTVTHKLNGTETDLSGGDTIGRNETLTPQGSGFKHSVTPDVGGATDTVLSAAFSPTSKRYADNSGESYGYDSELLGAITLARGGSVILGYSADGAKDLSTATWSQVTSGPFSIPGFTHGFTYNRSGQIKTVTDPSGSRTLGYQKGRLASTTYTTGILSGTEVVPAHDNNGRSSGSALMRDGAIVHSYAKEYHGSSGQIAALVSGPVKVVPVYDNATRVTGFQWGNSAGSFVPAVTQTWVRGVGGRIEYAGADVPGAPSFDYLLNPGNPGESFDSRSRRRKCQTAGGTWTYQYGSAGQLVSAVHPTLGSFSYVFDAIGRRTDKGNANATSILNQTTAWTHSQNKVIRITANPAARVWFNGTEIPNFTGSHSATVTPPGANGGWVEWHTLAVLEGAGEGSGNPPANPLAHPDAKSEQRGAVWVPPTSETLTYDAAGNRQGNAQWDYGWDGRNQLVRARTKNHSTAPQGWDISFVYDAEGRRVRKHVSELRRGAVVSEKEISFIWDGWDLLYERHQLPSGLTTLERRYLWGPDIADGAAGGAGGLLLIRETKGDITRDLIPLTDGSGHIVALTNLNKDLLATYAYGPFGEKISVTGPRATTNPWRWATKYLDEETGLYYFGHRYYDPITGQWLSREPLGESESVNLYSFCHNDPVNHVDVLGLAKVATDGRGNLNGFGNALVALAKLDPQAARSMLLAAQVETELGGAGVEGLIGDGGGNSISNVMRAIRTASGNARADGRNEWKHVALEARLGGGAAFDFDAHVPTTDALVGDLFASYSALITASADATARYDAYRSAESSRITAYQNSWSYKWREFADFPFDVAAFGISAAAATDVTTGNAVTWNSWNNGGGFGLAEVSPGERVLAGSLIMLGPISRGAGVVDDLARVGARGRSFAGTAARPWGKPLALPYDVSKVTYQAGTVRSFVTDTDEIFYRVYSGNNTAGSFLSRVRPRSADWATEAFALPPGNSADFIQEVLVPAGTRLQRSRAAANVWGRGGAEQFEILKLFKDQYQPVHYGPGIPFR